MTEARDDLKQIKAILRNNAFSNCYIHCDGALAGTYAPFITPKPSFDFKDGTDSIAISGINF